MHLIEDKAQQQGKHITKNRYWEQNGIQVFRHPLPVGDYILVNEKVQDVLDRKAARGIEPKKMDFLGTYDICVDSKFSIGELVADICGKSHERFRDECILAQNNGIKLIILVENDYEIVYSRNGREIVNRTITDLKDLHRWVNPRLWVFQGGKQKYPNATKGVVLMKACMTMEKKYAPLEFRFCSSKDAGKMIVELLTKES